MSGVIIVMLLALHVIPRTAWYQRARLRGIVKRKGAPEPQRVVVNRHGLAVVTSAEPKFIHSSYIDGWVMSQSHLAYPIQGYWPALRNTTFEVKP